jgi:lysophospholipase L1-like esterase
MTLGTNDAYGRNFHPEVFKKHYEELIALLRTAAPNAAILLTVPNDSYLFRKYPNSNTALTADVIRHLSQEQGVAMWDFYHVMGGFNSIVKWKHNNMAGKDLVHLTAEGYRMQGDLLFAAFIDAYERSHKPLDNLR